MTVAFDIFKNAKDYQTYPPGEMIFEEGAPGDVMYVVIEGEVDIVVKDKVVDQDYYIRRGFLDLQLLVIEALRYLNKRTLLL